jgi:hypothetical protein
MLIVPSAMWEQTLRGAPRASVCGVELEMSGPIVRKYGFPNFEKIFGDRGLQHGVEEEQQPPASEAATKTESARTPEPSTSQTKDEPKKG